MNVAKQAVLSHKNIIFNLLAYDKLFLIIKINYVITINKQFKRGLNKYRKTNIASFTKSLQEKCVIIIVCIHWRTIWKIGSHAKYVILLKYRNYVYYYYYYKHHIIKIK